MSGTWWLRGLEELMMNAEDIVAAAIAAARAQPVGTGAILALLALLFFVLGRRRTSQITTDDGSTPQTATSSSININFDAGVRRRVGLGSSVRTRIRKRDRVLHAGKVLLRGTQKMGDMLIGKRPVPQRNPLKRQEVPGALLEPMEAADFGTDEVPLEIRLLVESMRIFGHFNEPVFTDLYRDLETVKLQPMEYLFRVGDADDCMYIVKTGQMYLYSQPQDEPQTLIKKLSSGDNLTSLLSFLDLLTGGESRFITMSACAAEDGATVIRLRISAFQVLIKDNSVLLKQLVKVVTQRLQRVTYLVLFHFLGLSQELVRSRKAPQFVLEPMDGADAEKEINFMEQALHNSAEYLSGLLNVSQETIAAYGTVEQVDTGRVLILAGERDTDLIFLASGRLEVSLSHVIDGASPGLFAVEPGQICGELSVLSECDSFITVRSVERSVVVRFDRSHVTALLDERQGTLAQLVQILLSNLSPLVRRIDFGLDWKHFHAGSAIYKQGDKPDSIYIILSGRLRSVVRRADGGKELVCEFGRLELVGETEIVSESNRVTTVHAVRDSEVATLPATLFRMLKQRYPQILAHLMQSMSKRMLGSITGRNSEQQKDMRANDNLTTIAIVPVSEDVPLTQFTMELNLALQEIVQSTLHLNRGIMMNKFQADPNAFQASQQYQVTNWLADQEERHDIVLYEAEFAPTGWTQRCIRQADCILLVGLAFHEPSVSPVESQLEGTKTRAQKELVLLHHIDERAPSQTAEWLNLRSWCSMHHHVRCTEDILPSRITLRSPTIHPSPHKAQQSDVSRLARRITGTSVALVLGGGGARGIAHLGAIRALEEAGIPVDIVCGTSIGSLVGAMYAEDPGYVGTMLRSRLINFTRAMSKLTNQLLDLTYPYTAMFTGRRFNQAIERVFGDRVIEDLWIPYFCISTDITASQMRVHSQGSLWRYVRASMTLSGYLPPICDPDDGHLLLDGGYVNNLPVDVMRNRFRATTIIAVDVGTKDAENLTNYGDELSGWWVLWKRWNPFTAPVVVPSMAEISSRLAYIQCTQHLAGLQEDENFLYVKAPVEQYGTLQWGKFEAIEAAGYEYMIQQLEQWKVDKVLPQVLLEKDPSHHLKQFRSLRDFSAFGLAGKRTRSLGNTMPVLDTATP